MLRILKDAKDDSTPYLANPARQSLASFEILSILIQVDNSTKKTKTMSELALKLIKEAKDKRLTRLDLGNCGLTELPDELFELVWLEELILCVYANIYNFEKYTWEELRTKNDFGNNFNNILYISPKIRNLKKLKTFIMNTAVTGGFGYSCEKDISDIRSLKNLISLQTLILHSKDLLDITPLKGLINLKYLSVPSNNINDLSPLENLRDLRFLNVSFTKIYDLSPLKDLKNLQMLYVDNTQVSDLTPLKYLNNIRELCMSSTQISDLRPLKYSKNIQDIKITLTQVKDLYPLKKLRHIQSLDIHGTLVSDLRPIEKLINLKYLIITNSKVEDLSPLKKLINLKGFSCTYTAVRDLSPLKNLENLETLYVGDLVVNPPKAIVEQGVDAIRRYFKELENKETQTNNQTKLIFIGNSRAGKTSLWQFLKDKIYNEQADSTHGIKTEIWDTEPLGTEDNQNLAAHIWDFGGQEYYHATHRLFLADNAVYVLVWEHDSNKQGTRIEKFKLDDDPNGEIEEVDLEHFPASYWLDNIRYFGGAPCPVLIVQNKVDEEGQKANFTEGVQNIEDCFHLSVQNAFHYQEGNASLKRHDLRFQDFKERLLELLRKNATAFKLVKYYAQVREALETLAKDTEYIPVSELNNIALRFDETPDLENLLAYLKSFTNTVLYFPQNEVLKDRLYLNPTHISRDIYKILNKTVRDNKGKFDIAHIKIRLNLTDNQEAERFLALMHEFDLIFEKQDEHNEREFIAPQYLQQKDSLARGEKMILKTFQPAFYLRFKGFVPRSMMLRFIAQNGASAFEEFYWRNGIVYQGWVENKFIKVEYDSEARTFAIEVQDKQKQALDMQQVVAQFVKLNNSDDNIEISNDGKTYSDLRTIRNLQHENRRGDIYDKGVLIPLSHFDWLIEKHKTEAPMELERMKNQIHDLIGKGKLKEALNVFSSHALNTNNEQLRQYTSLLKARLESINNDKTVGLISYADADVQLTQLGNGILNMFGLIKVSEPKVYAESNETQLKETALKKTQDKPLSIFISYSKNDNELRQELHTHLSSLRRRKIVSNWDDRHIIGGELWDDTIKKKLKEADIILFLVSASFINTDYIWDYEIPIAEEQRKNGKARVIPIILKACQWTKLDFAKQQALPSKGVPINSFPDRDAAWLEVVESIEKVIHDVLQK